MSVPPRPRVALVLGSGGLKCAAALGLWRVLERESIPVDLVVGCSGGSLYGAAYALGFELAEAVRLTDLWQGVAGVRHAPSLLSVLFPRLFSPDRFGLVSARRLEAALAASFGERAFEDARVPLHVVATDLLSGERVELSSGLVRDAVRASTAIPLIFPPARLNGRLLVDGGVTNPLPVDVAIREGADIILAMGFEQNPVPPRSAATLAVQVSASAMNALLHATLAFHTLAHHAEVIPIVPALDRRVGLSDFDLVPWLVDEGERAAEREVPYLRKLLAPPAA